MHRVDNVEGVSPGDVDISGGGGGRRCAVGEDEVQSSAALGSDA